MQKRGYKKSKVEQISPSAVHTYDFYKSDTSENIVSAIPLDEVYECVTETDLSAYGFEEIKKNVWRKKGCTR